MSLNTWPSTIMAPSYGLDEEDVYPQVATTADDGTVQVTARYTRARCAWTLQWDNLPEDQYQTLKTFYRANRGLRFYWVYPIPDPDTGLFTTYTCVFGTANLKNVMSEPGHRRASVTILEV